MNNYDSKRIIESRGGICEFFDCDRLATEVHHKDKDRENNDDINLVILCSKCHVFVHHHMSMDEFEMFYKPVKRKKGDVDIILSRGDFAVYLEEENVPRSIIYALFEFMNIELVDDKNGTE